MHNHTQDRLWLIQDHHARLARDSAAERLVPPAQPVRRSISLSVVRIGRRLAGAPRLEPARSP